ncbi:SDR family oxidoreductase [Dactylosporangium sp. NPDC051484]|uniref:SDR family oxidoreductase n=1 Tax=Dactylosporangium sp. NPDC051484 TaxID=3154942 RepID=UPI00344BD497
MPADSIAVTGASGALGRLVVRRLLDLVPAGRIVAVVRDPARVADLAERGVTVRRGDYDEPAGLAEALAGVDRLLLISSPELDAGRRTAQHRGAIEAASKAGVGAVAYTSFLGADAEAGGLTEAHHATELAIRELGLPYTMLRNPFYTDAFVHPGLRTAVAAGELTSGTGGRGLNTATRLDLAEAAAAVLTGDGHDGRGYDLTGPLWTFPELAAVLSEVSGRPVAHREEPPAGPMGFLHGLARAGVLQRQTHDLARLLGRPATRLRDAVEAALAG